MLYCPTETRLKQFAHILQVLSFLVHQSMTRSLQQESTKKISIPTRKRPRQSTTSVKASKRQRPNIQLLKNRPQSVSFSHLAKGSAPGLKLSPYTNSDWQEIFVKRSDSDSIILEDDSLLSASCLAEFFTIRYSLSLLLLNLLILIIL